MDIKICDRCGKNYKLDNFFSDFHKNFIENAEGGQSHKTIDLCPKCEKEFLKWVKNGKD